jgi:hypothetical protein
MIKGIMIGLAFVAMTIGIARADGEGGDEASDAHYDSDTEDTTPMDPAEKKMQQGIAGVIIASLIVIVIKGGINRVEKRKMKVRGINWQKGYVKGHGETWEYADYLINEQNSFLMMDGSREVYTYGVDRNLDGLFVIYRDKQRIGTAKDLHEAQMFCVARMEDQPEQQEMKAAYERWLARRNQEARTAQLNGKN